MQPELPPEIQALLAKSQQHYQQHARLMLTVDTLGTNGAAWCSAHQEGPAPNGQVFSAAEILERANGVFGVLRTAGLVPVIAVCPLENGPPAKPKAKHRAAGDIALGGVQAVVLRQAPPRMLFAQQGEELTLLAAEVPVAEERIPAFVSKANAWLLRARFRG